jgi:hypothetical protein
MNPSELLLPVNLPVLQPDGKMDPTWWNFFFQFAQGISTIDLATQVTGTLSASHGGTGANNGSRSLTIAGFPLTLTQTALTALTMPTSGTLVSTTGLTSKRVSTGSISGGGSALVTVTWAVPFADTSYTALASVLDTTISASALSVVHIESLSVASISVRISNASGGALTGTVQAIAYHD